MKEIVFFLFFFLFFNCKKEVIVVKVIDGDTIVLENGERVRYLGIDAPETPYSFRRETPYWKEAKEFNEKLVKNKKVRLEFDVEKRDKYDRLLAYVFVGSTFVNGELVEKGYARVYHRYNKLRFYPLLKELEKKAKEKKLGIWREPDE
jgi:micrococcal nuclease